MLICSCTDILLAYFDVTTVDVIVAIAHIKIITTILDLGWLVAIGFKLYRSSHINYFRCFVIIH